jgi:hypothetical protein
VGLRGTGALGITALKLMAKRKEKLGDGFKSRENWK